MKILVVDVAADRGGALSILKNFIEKFKADTENEYTVVVGSPEFSDTENVKFIRLPWVKRSRLHRLFFDKHYIKKLIKEHAPDRVFSLQNKGFPTGGVPEDVYFHNALFICERRFKLSESRKLWLYQHPIARMTKRSLRHAERIFVQAEWIKRALSEKWSLPSEKIFVDKPAVAPVFREACEPSSMPPVLFYPAAFSSYKNHKTLIDALALVKEKRGTAPDLLLTGFPENFPEALRVKVEKSGLSLSFLGRISGEEMRSVYLRSVLVFPSYLETVGLPLLEAKALGRPIIAADLEYARESVGDYESVSYFSYSDAAELAERIEGAFS